MRYCKFKLCILTVSYAMTIVFAGLACPPAYAGPPPEKGAAQCGNGVLEPGETCTSCPADCAVRNCTPTTAGQAVTVRFAAPPDGDVSGVTVLLGYRSDRLSLPGHGAENTVRERVTETPDKAIIAVNDLDYGLRVVVGRSEPIASGKLYRVRFDVCGSAAAPTAADLACTVEACVTVFGPAEGCSCAAVW